MNQGDRKPAHLSEYGELEKFPQSGAGRRGSGIFYQEGYPNPQFARRGEYSQMCYYVTLSSSYFMPYDEYIAHKKRGGFVAPLFKKGLSLPVNSPYAVSSQKTFLKEDIYVLFVTSHNF